MCAVSYGGQMARQYKAELVILNVTEPGGAGKSECMERLEKTYGPRMEGIAKHSYRVEVGEPPMEILRLARQESAEPAHPGAPFQGKRP